MNNSINKIKKLDNGYINTEVEKMREKLGDWCVNIANKGLCKSCKLSNICDTNKSWNDETEEDVKQKYKVVFLNDK